MIPFQRLSLSMRHEVYQCFRQAGRESCEYSFTNLFLWGRQHAAWVDGYLAIFSHFYGHSMYLFPVGQGPLGPVLEALSRDARERGIPFRLTGMTGEDCRVVEELFPGQFQFCPDRDSFDYVYEIDHLAELKGKRYQQKRNHVNRFLTECPNWQAVPISQENLPDCQALAERWYQLRMEENPHRNFHLERLALRRGLQNYEALGLEGILLLDGEKPIAMSIGSRLSDSVFDVHFEKAFGDIPGDYAMINKTFALFLREHHPEIRYLNREDDMGLPGLRKAKESYHPDKLLEQYWCVLREDIDES